MALGAGLRYASPPLGRAAPSRTATLASPPCSYKSLVGHQDTRVLCLASPTFGGKSALGIPRALFALQPYCNQNRSRTPIHKTLRSYRNDATQNRTPDCAMTRPSLPIPNHWGVILILQPRCEPPGSASRCSQAHCLVTCHKDERSCRCRVVPRSGTLPPGPLNRCQSR